MPGLEAGPDMQPGVGPRRDLRGRPGIGLRPWAMKPEKGMKPEDDAPVSKDSPAAQLIFKDFYRVDEPITTERLAEIAPQMQPTRRRPVTRPAKPIEQKGVGNRNRIFGS